MNHKTSEEVLHTAHEEVTYTRNGDITNCSQQPSQICVPQEILTRIMSYLILEEMARCSQISKPWLRALAGIQELNINIDFCNQSDAIAIFNFASKYFHNLSRINIRCVAPLESSSRMCDAFSDLLAGKSKYLKHFVYDANFLSFPPVNLTNGLVQCLKDATNLETLIIDHCMFASDHDILLLLTNKPKLRKLKLCNLSTSHKANDGVAKYYCNIETFHEAIASFHQLQELELLLNCFVDHSPDKSAWSILLKELRKLKINYIDDTGLMEIARSSLPHLQDLNLRYCHAISIDRVIDVLHACPSIHTLDVSSLQMEDDAHIKELSRVGNSLVNLTIKV
uniref:F-box domain-containing protein n=1 Tax=Leptocylindrus danicus TaxID=163516 RepID=A0A7S2K3U4_9STRA|mmetsp:Transcript_17238/g.25649  ORF Transcript_17238/g.25649 Transcript_17238/m.25649 type:complete len:338 (+) Transcript_17238:69-1082(+)